MRLTSIALIGLVGFASTTFAQSSATPSSSASASASTSSLIPTGISSGCSDFLNSLNSDATLQACTAPLLSATQYYANATTVAKGNKAATSNVTDSASALKNSLGQLCANTTGCQPSTIRSNLSKFWNACGTELKSKNEQVIALYDVLYLINPFHDAVCTTDDNNNFCILSIANSTAAKQATTSKRSLLTDDAMLMPQLLERQDASETAESIDSGAASQSNIAYLFLQPTSEKNLLCSSCSKNIMAAYITFETSIPYAIGLSNSDQLKGQSALYKAMQATCGKDFTTTINQKAGTTAFAEVGGALSNAKVQITVTLAVASFLAVTLSFV
ncbi:uncharacterized protein FA14DRAFT_159493 [Meira miltonrushii]|uniref:Uncharacterized protein n=1 Tax=Meira miltonrushii TaxID=1280837 RepID=A0A316VII0_9BASI|nr:uncharacterized protein FA14DRAFT_159493 [Meira miltonrushii]PWN37439.1 hypothetical protein FA14DRAFT_159493 [Meira miltonrushii]